jgi:ArsR family transcriptional regulator
MMPIMEISKVLEPSAQVDPPSAFAALGDTVRIDVLHRLHAGTTCVCELAPALQIAPNLLSYHLRILREAGLVEGIRRGRRVEYRVRPTALRDLAIELVRLAVGGDDHEG